MQSINMMLENTFLLKLNQKYYKVLVCSSNHGAPPNAYHQYKGTTFEIQYGFLGNFLDRVVLDMKNVKLYSSNEHQSKMHEAYIQHFTNGDLNLHKTSQRHWIKDVGPIIETNIGFVETYLDAQGVRAEHPSENNFINL